MKTPMPKKTNNKCLRECGEREPSYTVGGNINWYRFLKKLKTFTIRCNPLLGIYPEKNKYLGINLTKEVKILYLENHNILIKGVENNTN